MPSFKDLFKQCTKRLRRFGNRIDISDKCDAATGGAGNTDENRNQESESQPISTAAEPDPSDAQDQELEYMNLPLGVHEELQKSIRLHRQLIAFEEDHTKTINTLQARFRYVKREIKELQEGIAKLEAEDPGANENDIEIKKFDLEPLLREKEELLDQRDEANDELDAKCRSFRSETFHLLELWRQVIGDCEEAREGEDESVDPTGHHIDEHWPIEATADLSSAEEQRSKDEEPASSNTPGPLSEQARPPTPEPQSQDPPPNAEELLEDYKRCWRELESAEWCLDNRDLRFDADMECCYRLYQAKAPGFETKSQVERRHFRETQEITQRIITAEEELEKAEQALTAAGIHPPGSEYGLGMVKDVEDGYRVSEEVEDIETGQDSRVQKWLKNVPSSIEGDDASEPEVWDSLSMVAEGRQKKKIVQWREQAEAAAPAIVEAQPLPVPERTSPKGWKSKTWKVLKDLAKSYPAVPLLL
ncbi:hypothetical protein M409DRAFT_18644 [Zasmidium cellare ATCC 36951]|uniref:Uncharacterized protein n=1 Tax=Zasmidium cellare ATCC 36951 TaxID=1080233 RepID=A0A6A6D046_ZASCE|nr:uncharacterized protein M409DRAFT_18644 [Zasmidium cellare ATCC 36951]KAF2171532.1 hypothetical protein M409DRAFT_18644 [Zasmidium cellare ATCC 36951]